MHNGTTRRGEMVGHIDETQIGTGRRIADLAQRRFHGLLPLFMASVSDPEIRFSLPHLLHPSRSPSAQLEQLTVRPAAQSGGGAA